MKHARKLISLLLALAMVFAIALPAWADNPDSGDANADSSSEYTLTIKTTNKHIYEIYQLLKGDIPPADSDDTSDGTTILDNIKLGANIVNSHVNDDGTSERVTVESFIEAIKELSGETLGEIAYSYVDTTTSVEYSITGTGNDEKITVVGGYYLIVDTYSNSEASDPPTDGSDVVSRYMVVVAKDVTVTPKVAIPEIDKKIIDTDSNKPLDNDGKVDTAAIGDTIEFEITGGVPDVEGYDYYYYVVKDTLSPGLTLNENSFFVKIGETVIQKATDQESEVAEKYYVITESNSDGSTSFSLALNNLKFWVTDETSAINSGDPISIKYEATINEKAKIGTDPNINTAKLQYSNNPNKSVRHDSTPGIPGEGTATGEGPDKTTETYVTALTILKVDEDGKKLSGAEFTLTGENLNKVIIETDTYFEKVEEGKGQYYLLKNGTYTKEPPSNAEEDEEGYNANLYRSTTSDYIRVTGITTATDATSFDDNSSKTITGSVNNTGYVTFTGLNAGTYTLTETKTPIGYTTMEPITFTITASLNADLKSSIVWASDSNQISLDSRTSVFDATIENKSGSTLPSTGGMGTALFYIVGGILVVGAAVLLITKRRMENEEK